MKTTATFTLTHKKTMHSVAWGVLAAIVVFLTGFFTLFLFWTYTAHDPNLPGLFDYRAATWGDAICLPLLTGALVTYSFFRRGQEKSRRLAEIIASLIFGAAAAAAQAQWLISDSTGLNWTIPRQHHFNAPGWWHAIFFVAMFAALGFWFTRFFKVKKAEIQEKKQLFDKSEDVFIQYGFQMIVQTILWFAGALFLFLLALDNYATEQNAFRPLLILLVLLLAVIGIFYIAIFGAAKAISIKKYRKLAKPEIAPILSGVFSAFALANIMYGGIHTNIWYIVACAFLLVVLVVPDDNKKPQMALYYVLISIPALLLECAISSQVAFASSAIIFCLAILVPCLIAVCQENSTETPALRRAVLTAVIVLFCIASLIALFLEEPAKENQSLLESLMGAIFTLSIPRYVTGTFSNLVAAENNSTKDIVTKKRELLYFLYVLVLIGALILLVNVFFPSIPLFCPGEVVIGGVYSVAIIVFTAAVLCLFVLGMKRRKRSKISKVIALICVTVAYAAALLSTLSSAAFSDFSFQGITWCFYLSVIAMVCYPVSIICGFKNNLCNLRGVHADTFTVAGQIIIFVGLLPNIFAAAIKMMYYHSRMSIGINLLYIMVLGAGLPALVGRVIRTDCTEPQLAKNTQIGGVLQDGFMYGISIFMDEILSIFLLPSIIMRDYQYTSILEFLAVLFSFLVLVAWLLIFCIKNNITHYQDRKKDLNQESVEEKRMILEGQLKALGKYLKVQNIFAFGNAFPYSIAAIVMIVVDYIGSNEKGWKGLKYRFFPDDRTNTHSPV